jgi:hypothetical protein
MNEQNLLFKDSSLNVLSQFTHNGDLNFHHVFQSNQPLAALSLFTMFLSNSSVAGQTLLVSSSKNRIALSLALCFKGCGVIHGKAISLTLGQYHNILFNNAATVDLPHQVFQAINIAGFTSNIFHRFIQANANADRNTGIENSST